MTATPDRPPGPKLRRFAAGFLLLTAAVTFAVWALRGYGTDAARLAGSADREDRIQAIDLLRQRTDDTSRQVLFGLCSDGDLRVAATAVWALGQAHDAAAGEMLLKLLADKGRHGRVRGEAAAMLGRFKDVPPVFLTRALAEERDPAVRAGAARGLYGMRARRAVPALVGALRDPDRNVRKWVLAALHHMTVRRFGYDPSLPPDRQAGAIREIEDAFREAGAL
ncbi:MAG TPA: HEAT repeat domain-containing protein [Phycisphaerae bacterium]|nr:HEAT repeat domain-containing protein [Phycisphaerae bacterium]